MKTTKAIYVEFFELFKMLTDFKLKVCAVFFQSWKTERPVFILAIVTRKLGVLNGGKDKQDRYRQTKQPGDDQDQ